MYRIFLEKKKKYLQLKNSVDYVLKVHIKIKNKLKNYFPNKLYLGEKMNLTFLVEKN